MVFLFFMADFVIIRREFYIADFSIIITIRYEFCGLTWMRALQSDGSDCCFDISFLYLAGKKKKKKKLRKLFLKVGNIWNT